jgi:glycosyltransferase involved in cell wall biosynthesis
MINKEVLLLIHPSRTAQAREKGVLGYFEKFLESGYFGNLIAFSFLGKHSSKYHLSNQVTLVEEGWSSGYSRKLMLGKFIGVVLLFFRLIFIWIPRFKNYQPIIIRSTEPQLSGIYSYLISKILRIPLVISVHSNYDECHRSGGYSFTILGRRSFGRMLEGIILSRSAHIICISNYLKRWVVETHRIDQSKVSVVHHAYYGAIYNRTLSEISAEQKICISVVSRLSNEKHSLDLLLLAGLIKQNLLPFRIFIAGDGPLMAPMMDYVYKNDLENILSLKGFVDQDEVYSLRKSCLIHISLLDGMSLVEAAACSQCIVAYDNEWHSELIDDGMTGFLTKSRNVYALLDKLSTIKAMEPAQIHQICKQACERVTLLHSPEKSAQATAKIYSTVLNV